MKDVIGLLTDVANWRVAAVRQSSHVGIAVLVVGIIPLKILKKDGLFIALLTSKKSYKQKFDKNSERRYTGFLNYLLHWIFLYRK